MTERSRLNFDIPELQARFDEDELYLRSRASHANALGRNDSDYHNMWGLFLRVIRRAEAIDNDPQAFLSPSGAYDTKAVETWAKLIDNGRKILEGLNKMRNSDRLTVHILESHTRSFAEALAGPLGVELRAILTELQQVPEASHVTARLARLVNDGVVTIFRRAALETITKSKEEYKLH